MQTYKGIFRGHTVILEQAPDVQDGTEALVLVKAPEEEERQKALLERGFSMGKLRDKSRGELHARGR